MRMPFGSGFERVTPSMRTAPVSGCTKPAIMFMSVVLPQPDGPMIATVSPSRTVKVTSSMTTRRPWSYSKLLLRPLTSILLRIAPANPLDAFQPPHATVERQADHSDDDHAGDHQIVAIAGIARVHDHVAEAGTQRDHLRGDDDQPRNAQPDPHSDHDLRQHRRDHHLPEQRGPRDPEVL